MTKQNLTRRKNIKFAALVRGDRLCRRRRHTHGDVPANWLERLAELQDKYRLAVAEVAQNG